MNSISIENLKNNYFDKIVSKYKINGNKSDLHGIDINNNVIYIKTWLDDEYIFDNIKGWFRLCKDFEDNYILNDDGEIELEPRDLSYFSIGKSKTEMQEMLKQRNKEYSKKFKDERIHNAIKEINSYKSNILK